MLPEYKYVRQTYIENDVTMRKLIQKSDWLMKESALHYSNEILCALSRRTRVPITHSRIMNWFERDNSKKHHFQSLMFLPYVMASTYYGK